MEMRPHWINDWQIPDVWGKYYLTGSGIKIAILDTGIDFPHPDFRDAVNEASDFCDSRGTAQDVDGHGTHLAGIIGARGNLKGLSPGADFYIGRVMTHYWIVADEPVTRGILWAIEKGVNIIAISCCFGYQDESLYQAIKKAYENNILIVASIGNKGGYGSQAGCFPARYSEVIGVGSVNRQMKISEFTDKSNSLDILAPGEDMLSTDINGGYKEESGTSQATAFISGVLCLLLEFCKKNQIAYNPEMIKKILYATGKKHKFRNYEYRVVDPMAALKHLSGLIKPPAG